MCKKYHTMLLLAYPNMGTPSWGSHAWVTEPCRVYGESMRTELVL